MNLFGGHGSTKLGVKGKPKTQKAKKGTAKASRKKREKTKVKLAGLNRMFGSW